jgi:hypothetical protein
MSISHQLQVDTKSIDCYDIRAINTNLFSIKCFNHPRPQSKQRHVVFGPPHDPCALSGVEFTSLKTLELSTCLL